MDNGLELDIYIPDLKLGIEFNGSYWHYEYLKSADYHKNKSVLALKNGIRLIHIFEYEWINNRLLIEKFLKNTISQDQVKIYARDTKLVTVSNDTARDFMNDNHLQGYIKVHVRMVYHRSFLQDI